MVERELSMRKVLHKEGEEDDIIIIIMALLEAAKKEMRRLGDDIPDDAVRGSTLMQVLISVVVNTIHFIATDDNGVLVAQLICTEIIQAMRDVQSIEKQERDNVQ